MLADSNLNRDDLFITTTVKCRPSGNRTPRKLEVDTRTSPYLSEQIDLINLRLITLLGGERVSVAIATP